MKKKQFLQFDAVILMGEKAKKGGKLMGKWGVTVCQGCLFEIVWSNKNSVSSFGYSVLAQLTNGWSKLFPSPTMLKQPVLTSTGIYEHILCSWM